MTVPAHALYVLGDNRAESEDSRTWGPVDENAVIGKAIVGLWPPEGLALMTEPPAPQIQWFPGHMVRAMRLLEERLALVDVVIEVLDARLPLMSSNPELDRIVGARPRLVILGREDLADPFATRRWLAWYAAQHRPAFAVDGRMQPSVNRARAELDRFVAGRGPSRAIVIGIPNTGKSSLINGLAKRTAAKTENKAGVTRQLRWIRANARPRSHGHARHSRSEDSRPPKPSGCSP